MCISIYANAAYKPLRKDPPKAQQVVTAKSPSPSSCSTAQCLLVLGLEGLSPAGHKCVAAFGYFFLPQMEDEALISF